MPRFENVATPLDAVAVVVPTSVAPALTVAVTTVELSLVTTLLPPSCNETCGWVEKATPTTGSTGVLTDTTFVGDVATTIALFAPRDPEAPGDASISVAALPAESAMVPPFSARAEVEV